MTLSEIIGRARLFEVLGQRLWLPLGSKLTMWWRHTISLFVSSDNPFSETE